MNTSKMSAQDLERQAMTAYEAGNWAQAEIGFHEAHQAFQREGNRLKSAEMSNNLCVVLLQVDRPQEALEAVEGTCDIFAAEGDDLRTAQSYGNLASAREACGDLAGAEEAYRQAAQLLEKAGATDDRAQTLTALSRIQLKRGKALQAVASMQSGLDDSPRLSFGKRILRKILRLPLRLLGR
jgi:tetratricopeptide (TPR) repeat protein